MNLVETFFEWIFTLFQPKKVTVIAPESFPAPRPLIPLAPPEPPKPHTRLLEAFCDEIQAMEGWWPGSTSYECCNPGNIRCAPGDNANWNQLALGSRNGFCTFRNEATGMEALVNVTLACAEGRSAKYTAEAKKIGVTNSGELNLYQYFMIRDPSGDGNDPKALAERFGRKMRADPSIFKMKDLL